MLRLSRLIDPLIIVTCLLNAAFPVWRKKAAKKHSSPVCCLVVARSQGRTAVHRRVSRHRVPPGSDIAALIRDDQIGGVILSTENGNLSNVPIRQCRWPG